MITGQRLFGGDNEGVVITRILEGRVTPPSRVLTNDMKTTLSDRAMRDLESLDRVVMRALVADHDSKAVAARRGHVGAAVIDVDAVGHDAAGR